MNVSMMDAYNLSWKLAHVLQGVAPGGFGSPAANSLLATYEAERLDIARQLIDFDTKFSSMFSGKIGEGTGLTHEQFVEVFRTGGGFTSGCGIEYKAGLLVWKGDQPTEQNITKVSQEAGLVERLKGLLSGWTGIAAATPGAGGCVPPKVSPIQPGRPELGLLVPGRRVINVTVKRFADASPRDLQDGRVLQVRLCSHIPH